MSNDSYTGFHAYWIEQWSQFLGGCNWYTFHPIHIEFEDDRIMGGVEVTVIILGLGFRARWNYAETEQVSDIKASVKAVLEDIDRPGA